MAEQGEDSTEFYDASVDVLLVAASNDRAARERLLSHSDAMRIYEDRFGDRSASQAVENSIVDIWRAVMTVRATNGDERNRLPRLVAALAGADPRRTHGLLDRLPSGQRAVLRLRVQDGLGTADTARTLGLTPATVRVAEHRALATLFRALGEPPPPA